VDNTNAFDLLLPDDLLDQHFADTGVESEPKTPEPDAEDESPEDDAQETSEEEPEDEAEETDEDDAGNEPADEEEDEDDEDSEETSEEEPGEQPDDNPFFDRKELDAIKDEEARKVALKAYKAMQSAFTKKTQETAAIRREAEAVQQEFDEFLQEISSEEGAADFMVRVALSRPEAFQAAQDRITEMTDDDNERRVYERDQKLKAREKELERKERMEQIQARHGRVEEVEKMTARLARQAGMDQTEVAIAEQYVANRILLNRAGGRDDISDHEVAEAVKLAAQHLGREKERVRKSTEREIRQRQAEQVKRKATAPKRPAAPKSSTAPAARSMKRNPTAPAGVDPTDFAIDKLLGLDD
jgi:hypothetical protein